LGKGKNIAWNLGATIMLSVNKKNLRIEGKKVSVHRVGHRLPPQLKGWGKPLKTQIMALTIIFNFIVE
jgi:hypothetical protein